MAMNRNGNSDWSAPYRFTLHPEVENLTVVQVYGQQN